MPPDYHTMYTFGCVCFVTCLLMNATRLHLNQFSLLSQGYSIAHKGFVYFDIVVNRLGM